MALRTADGHSYRIRAMTIPSGEEAVFATSAAMDLHLDRAAALVRPKPIRMDVAILRPPAGNDLLRQPSN